MKSKAVRFWLGGGLVLVGMGLILASLAQRSPRNRQAMPPPTRTTEPLVPTGIPVSSSSPSATLSLAPSAEAAPTAHQGQAALFGGRPRWCAGVAIGPITRYNIAPLRLGWYLDWQVHQPSPWPEVEYTPMVRLKGGTLDPDAETIQRIAQSRPGALWLIGNEPDVLWQDGVTPEVYSRLYHDAYSLIKAADPSAQVAIGGVSQPTPLRLRYLDAVLERYRVQYNTDMPVDVWNIHNFTLREERGSWGVGIPPGFSDDQGQLYAVDDSANLKAFQQQVWNFRRWMASRGLQNFPLIISEYGIVMPEDYGFPPERVVAFLYDSFDFMLTANDPTIGYPADEGRLVQRWCWYSLDDTTYPTGRLFDPATGERTAVGQGWVNYVASRVP